MLRMQTTVCLGLALAAFALSGCSSMNQAECQSMDWRTVGYEDGVAGRSADGIGRYRKSCGKFGVAPNLDQYQSGREQGLREFCKPANGFRIGARGHSYGGVCPDDLDRDFMPAYETGRQLHTLRARASQANSRLANAHDEINRIDSDLIKLGADIINPQTTAEQRAQMLLDTKQMAERRGALKKDIPQLERERDYAERDLSEYRSTLQYVE